LIEKVVAALLLLGGVASVAANSGRPIAVLFLAPNILVFALVLLRRRAVEVGDRPLDWILPLAASVAPQLLVAVSAPPLVPNWLAVVCMAFGGLLSLASLLSLGRSFGIFPANRGVKRYGPYALVRHPMYLGYGFWQLGFVLANPGPYNAAIFALAVGLQAWRIQREERILADDPLYLAYRRKVPARLLPGLY
jgi:protein-S-isoprenylcysteine O-methyltransferase Ste14